jgi:signal transduction histidine kinase
LSRTRVPLADNAVHPASLRLRGEGSLLDIVRLLRQHPVVKLRALAWAAVVVSSLLVVYNLLIGLQTAGHPAPLLLQFRWFEALLPFMGLGFALVGALIVNRPGGNRIGLLACAIGVLVPVYVAAQDYATYGLYINPGALPGAAWAGWLRAWVWYPAFALLVVYLPLVFPDGRLPSPRWRLVAWINAGLIGVYVTVTALVKDPVHLVLPAWLANGTETITAIGQIASVIAAAIALFLRYRRSPSDVQHQIKWLMAGIVVQAALWVVGTALMPFYGIPPYRIPVVEVLIPIALLFLPAAIGIAILRHGLYDIDLLIDKALVYATLAVFITATYVLIVGGAGILAGSRFSLALSVLATAAVAVAFQPVRQRVQQLAARLVFGDRTSASEILARLSRATRAALSVDGVLIAVAMAASDAAGGRPARVVLLAPADDPRSVTWPHGAKVQPTAQRIAIDDRGLSELQLGGDPLKASERHIVDAVAAQADLAMHNLTLAAELAASRTRLVQAEERGRRRLERDLHDGVQQQIVALIAKLRLARNHLPRDPAHTEDLLMEAQSEAQQALSDLRELARGIHPAVLGSRGLVDAAETAAARMPIPVRVEADECVRGTRYAEEIEGAAYFTISEAMANVLKHAGASEASLGIAAVDSTLSVTIADNGCGFDKTSTRQRGLEGLRDRIEALGGSLRVDSGPRGTRLAATLPARAR